MFEQAKPGELYRKACKMLGNAPPNPARQARLNAGIKMQRQRIRELETSMAADRLSASEKEKAAKSSDLARAEDELSGLVSIREQKDFRRAMRVTGMGLRVEQVVRFSTIGGIIALAASLCVAIPFASWMGLDAIALLLVAAGCSLAAPLIAFMLLVGYPERLAGSLEVEAFGSAPEVVNYIVMSMELSPSLDRAVAFAAENAEGPMADELKSLIWKVRAREFPTIEDALMAYASELEGVNEELRSAIYNILSASKESDREKMRTSLRRASDSVLAGTRQRVEGFAASLATPATVLFSLGILLPMIIGSLLPMISLGGFDIGVAQESQSQGWQPIFAMSVLMMNVLFPVLALVYARHILSGRPGLHTVSLPEPKSTIGFPLAIILFAVFAITAYLTGARLDLWGLGWSFAALLLVLGAAASMWLLMRSRVRRADIRSMERLEDQMPDMLFQLGSRLGEGRSLERALEDVSRTMRDTEMGDFLAGMLARMRRSGSGLQETLFAKRGGMLNAHPSRKLRATMRLVVEASSKDQETVASMLMTMSNHMRDLSNSDKDMRLKLRSTIDSMKNTAVLFAPVIMGVTVGLYALLSRTFGEMNGAETMPAPHFIMIIGVYLLTTVVTIMYFCSGIERGRGRWRGDAGIALPVAALIFCATSVGALLAFG